jgi:hypothetical protein
MEKKQRIRMDKIILLAAIFSGIFFVGLWLSLKRATMQYYLPEGFSGWVSVTYRIPDAPPLEKKDGKYQVFIPEDGILETSTALHDGWGKDEYFRMTASGPQRIEKFQGGGDEPKTLIHSHDLTHYNHYPLAESLPVGKDTFLWDGSRTMKEADGSIRYQRGKKVFGSFYVSPVPEPFYFEPPPNPNDHALLPVLQEALKQKEQER